MGVWGGLDVQSLVAQKKERIDTAKHNCPHRAGGLADTLLSSSYGAAFVASIIGQWVCASSFQLPLARAQVSKMGMPKTHAPTDQSG